jgi:hypothetical protein
MDDQHVHHGRFTPEPEGAPRPSGITAARERDVSAPPPPLIARFLWMSGKGTVDLRDQPHDQPE